VSGVNKSRMMKWMLRKNQKAGYELRIKTVEEEME
jgi:hypothetical protein